MQHNVDLAVTCMTVQNNVCSFGTACGRHAADRQIVSRIPEHRVLHVEFFMGLDAAAVSIPLYLKPISIH